MALKALHVIISVMELQVLIMYKLQRTHEPCVQNCDTENPGQEVQDKSVGLML